MDLEALAREAVDCGFQTHDELGPGLLESVYEAVLVTHLLKRGLRVERQKSISFARDGTLFNDAFRVDVFIEGMLVVEVKSLEKLLPPCIPSRSSPTYD